jgi:hypothetical protein
MSSQLVRGPWWVIASSVFLGACVVVPIRGTRSHYALDSVSNACLRNPQACATLTGKEVTTVQAVGTAVASGAAVLGALDDKLRSNITEKLEDCADLARSEVLIRHRKEFENPSPSDEECRQMTKDSQGRRVTWAMRLGAEMHAVARQCAETELNKLRPGGFSLEPCYRYDKNTGQTTFISCEEVQELLNSGCGSALKGTLRPDVVIHSGHPLKAQEVFDFKFPCVISSDSIIWREYPPGHPCHPFNQAEMYQKALGPYPQPIFPRWGAL